ncbi:MAG: hypothetical protein QOI06_2402 [Nocardioidaceae bacterium]|jgi:hypothetical protein|nr:hypothetical protein [Nocardioidaceae bacterium]
MDEQQFWRIVDDSYSNSFGEIEVQRDVLYQVLSEVSAEEIVAFDVHLAAAIHALYRWELRDAARLLVDAGNDYRFRAFRSWVVFKGRDVYQRVMADPDALAGVVSFDVLESEVDGADFFTFLANHVYDDLHGQELELTAPEPEGPGEPPTGTRSVDESYAATAARFPPQTHPPYVYAGQRLFPQVWREPSGLLEEVRYLVHGLDVSARWEVRRWTPCASSTVGFQRCLFSRYSRLKRRAGGGDAGEGGAVGRPGWPAHEWTARRSTTSGLT